jgi:hypothetical protein
MRENLTLLPGETVLWEARPAPRCYTFRHWRHALFGAIFLAICGYWQVLGLAMAEQYALAWLALLPTPFVLIGLYLSVGHLLQARLEWNRVYYAITDRRLLVQRGVLKQQTASLPLDSVTYFSLHSHGEALGTLRVYEGKEQRVVLHCIEHPRQATELIEKAMGDKARPVTTKTSE